MVATAYTSDAAPLPQRTANITCISTTYSTNLLTTSSCSHSKPQREKTFKPPSSIAQEDAPMSGQISALRYQPKRMSTAASQKCGKPPALNASARNTSRVATLRLL